MLRRIVVPLDGSRFGEQVLPLATELAERHHADLELVHVFEALAPYLVQGAPPIDPALDADLRRSRLAYLDQLADRMRSASSVQVETRVLDGTEVVSTLADHIADRNADLVIVTTHGRGGLNRLWVGSVATGLVHRSEVPVLLLRAADAIRDGLPKLRKILVPMDGTPADEEGIGDALAIAVPFEAEIVLLNVREPVDYFEQDALTPNDTPEYDADTTSLGRSAASELESVMNDYLDQIARPIRGRGFSVTTQVVVDASPAHAILRVAEAWDIDLIVLETHVRSGMSRLLHGRVTDKVIRGAHVPVLVHRRLVESDGRVRGERAASSVER